MDSAWEDAEVGDVDGRHLYPNLVAGGFPLAPFMPYHGFPRGS